MLALTWQRLCPQRRTGLTIERCDLSHHSHLFREHQLCGTTLQIQTAENACAGFAEIGSFASWKPTANGYVIASGGETVLQCDFCTKT